MLRDVQWLRQHVNCYFQTWKKMHAIIQSKDVTNHNQKIKVEDFHVLIVETFHKICTWRNTESTKSTLVHQIFQQVNPFRRSNVLKWWISILWRFICMIAENILFHRHKNFIWPVFGVVWRTDTEAAYYAQFCNMKNMYTRLAICRVFWIGTKTRAKEKHFLSSDFALFLVPFGVG